MVKAEECIVAQLRQLAAKETQQTQTLYEILLSHLHTRVHAKCEMPTGIFWCSGACMQEA